MKWKNYINNYLFDDSQNHRQAFKDNLDPHSEKCKRRSPIIKTNQQQSN